MLFFSVLQKIKQFPVSPFRRTFLWLTLLLEKEMRKIVSALGFEKKKIKGKLKYNSKKKQKE